MIDDVLSAHHKLFMLVPEPYVVSDGDGMIMDLNLAAQGLFGGTSSMLGRRLEGLLRPADRSSFQARLAAMIPGDLLTFEVGMTSPTKGDRRVSLSGMKHLVENEVRIYWLFRDVTEQVQAEEAVRDLNQQMEARVSERTAALGRRLEQLKKANAAKDEFLSIISHELRTPLTIALGNARFLSSHRYELSTEDVEESLNDIIASGDRLQHLIDDLLNLARADMQEGLRVEPVLLQQTLPALVNRSREQWAERDIRVEAAEDLPSVAALPPYLEQVVTNLLSNACKYGEPGSPITIACRPGKRTIAVEVRNRGKPIPEADYRAVFQPFFRARATRSKAGVGIGLTVVKRLLEAQGGRIWIMRQPMPDDVGFCFTLRMWDRTSAFQERRDLRQA